MKLIIYRIFYLFSLLSSFVLTLLSFINTLIISLKYENKEECIIFCLCLIILLMFIGLQIFNIISSFIKGGQFIHYLLFNNKEFEINKKFLIIINILLVLVISLLTYGIIIYLYDLGLLFNNAFIGVKYLLINFSIVIIINIIFIDTYLLVYKQDKIIRKV